MGAFPSRKVTPDSAMADGSCATDSFELLHALASTDGAFEIAQLLDVRSLCRLAQTSHGWRAHVQADVQAWRARALELGLDAASDSARVATCPAGAYRSVIREAWSVRIGDALEVLDTCGQVGVARVLAKVDDPSHGPLLLLGFESRTQDWMTWVHRVHDRDRLRPLTPDSAVMDADAGLARADFERLVRSVQAKLLRGTSTWAPPCGSRDGRWPWPYKQLDGGTTLGAFKIGIGFSAKRAWYASQVTRPFKPAAQLARDRVACISMWLAATAMDGAGDRPIAHELLSRPWPPERPLADAHPRTPMSFEMRASDSATTRTRVGHEWQAGERLEARDHCGYWYVARIVSYDRETGYVHVHFEGWDDRWDEFHTAEALTIRPYAGLQRYGARGDEEHDTRWGGDPAEAIAAAAAAPPPPYAIGQRVEAQDYMGVWYAARIVEWLPHNHWRMRVHFCGWSEAFDEWHDASSPTLRPFAGLQHYGPNGAE